MDSQENHTDHSCEPVAQLLDAALLHVVFDGWSEATFEAAITDTGINPVLARAICPSCFALACIFPFFYLCETRILPSFVFCLSKFHLILA